MSNENQSPEIFDRPLVRRHRARAAPGLSDHDFLFREVAGRLAERLDTVNRTFGKILLLGARGGAGAIAAYDFPPDSLVIAADLTPELLTASANAVVMDEEQLPLAPESLDLVISNLSLHWVNDLPGALIQIRRALKPDGLFLGAMFGGDSLHELRSALIKAELRTTGGAGTRVSPFADIRDLGHLLQRAGFALPVTDADTIPVSYATVLALMQDLRGMGEGNALRKKNPAPLTRSMLVETEAAYREMPESGARDGRLKATFQVIYLTGWAPHPDQPQPLKPGSAKARLADALGTKERSVKE